MSAKVVGHRVDLDISIQVKQKSADSCLALSNLGLKYSVCLPLEVKHAVLSKKRFRNISDRKSKMHAIMIYFCIHKFLNEISCMKICPDGTNPKQLSKYLLNFLFNDSERKEFLRIKPRFKGVGSKSNAHKHAKICRKNKSYDLVLYLVDIEKLILEMQEKSSMRG